MRTLRPMRCFVGPRGFVYVLRHASRLSKTPHFGGCAPKRRAMTPKFELCRDFCTMHPSPKFHHPVFTRSEVIVLTNTLTNTQTRTQTNRSRRKHPTFFATLRRWVTSALDGYTRSRQVKRPRWKANDMPADLAVALTMHYPNWNNAQNRKHVHKLSNTIFSSSFT